jgi:hypothetical protein
MPQSDSVRVEAPRRSPPPRGGGEGAAGDVSQAAGLRTGVRRTAPASLHAGRRLPGRAQHDSIVLASHSTCRRRGYALNHTHATTIPPLPITLPLSSLTTSSPPCAPRSSSHLTLSPPPPVRSLRARALAIMPSVSHSARLMDNANRWPRPRPFPPSCLDPPQRGSPSRSSRRAAAV